MLPEHSLEFTLKQDFGTHAEFPFMNMCFWSLEVVTEIDWKVIGQKQENHSEDDCHNPGKR